MLHGLFRTFTLLSSLALGACMQAGISLANLPLKFSGISVDRDVAYGADSAHLLDLYLPVESHSIKGKSPHPVVVFFYGGTWSSGSKADYGFVGAAFASRGYIVAIPDYRKYPEVTFPAFVEDGAQALAWLKENVSVHGGDVNRLFLLGHSSGAHTAALLASDAVYLHARDLAPSDIRGVAGLAGPYDFVPDTSALRAIFGPPARYPQMQLSNFIDGTEPPMLLLHGAEDKTVDISNLRRLEAAIMREGGSVHTRLYPGMTHVSLIASLSWLSDRDDVVLTDILAFFDAAE